jgi:peptide/nickel transport system substrate-binding protein
MKRRDRLAVSALALMLAIVGAAMFVPTSAPSPSPTPAAPTAAPAVTYREGVVGHPGSINPLTASTQVDRDLVALLFRGLVRAGPNGTLLPDLARSWAVSADSLTYTFTMRSDARWEDGQPVTAADVVFTVNLAQDPDYDGPLGGSWDGITATAVSTDVVRFTLPTPLGGFLRQTLLPILPQHLLAQTAVTDLATSDFSGQPIGDGPYRIAEMDDTHVLLTRVADAPAASDGASSGATGGASSGPPAAATTAAASAPASATATAEGPTVAATPAPEGNVDSIELVFFDTEAAAVASFKTGDIDAIGDLTPLLTEAAATRTGSRVARYQSASMYSVVLNQRPAAHPEFGKLSARQGLLAAIDRASILKSALGGLGTVADVPLPSWSPYYEQAAVSVTGYSLTDAQADLVAAGWARAGSGWTLPGARSPYALELMSPNETTNPVAYDIAVQVVAAWKALGIDVSLQTFDAADYTQNLTAGTFDAAVVDYQLGLDPDVSPLLLSSQAAPAGANLSAVADTSLDQLLTAARTTSDPAARQTAISAVEKYVSTNLLMLPVCFSDYEFVLSDRVQGVSTNAIADPSDRYWDVLDWRLASDG